MSTALNESVDSLRRFFCRLQGENTKTSAGDENNSRDNAETFAERGPNPLAEAAPSTGTDNFSLAVRCENQQQRQLE